MASEELNVSAWLMKDRYRTERLMELSANTLAQLFLLTFGHIFRVISRYPLKGNYGQIAPFSIDWMPTVNL